MLNKSPNPPLPFWVPIFFLMVASVLCVGVGLLVLPAIVMPRWLWQVTPFNARFLGAIYLTELSVVIPLLLYNRRSPGHLVLPCALTFVAVISILTLFYLDHFDMQRLATYGWFIVYFVPTLILVYLVWQYRTLLASVGNKLSQFWRNLLLIESSLLTLYSVGLLVFPIVFSAFWPWAIDPFHARMYSAFFLTLAVGAFVVAQGADRLDVLTLGIAQTTTGISVIGGLLLVDAAVRRVNWFAAGTWLWIVSFGVLGVIGLLLIGHSNQMPSSPK